MKDDGSVEFEVPEDIESLSINVESEEIFTNVDDEPLDTSDFQYIRPMQIVILIVGTRGDVQPFIPIGKRLQVIDLFAILIIISFSPSQIASCCD